jgi:urease accessory protein
MIANVNIQVELRDCVSYLKDVYCTTPFKVADITEDKKTNPLKLMLMSSSPGILDGDEYTLNIELAKECSLQLHTQSYQRLFTMKTSAKQMLNVHLKQGASFCFLPHPTVPHEGALFISNNNFYLTDDCSLIFGEILTSGRKLHGESFKFTKYHTLTKVFINNKLIIKENLLIQPALMNMNAMGQLEGYTHQASLIYIHPDADIKQIISTVSDQLNLQQAIAFGVSEAPVNGFVLRLLSQKAEQLFDCLKLIVQLIPQYKNLQKVEYAI